MSDELKLVLEDVKEKFDTVIEAFTMVKENLDQFRDENKQEHEELRKDILGLQVDLVTVKKDMRGLKSDMVAVKDDFQDLKSETSSIRQGLNDHRTNTELHNVKSRGKAI